MTDDEVKKEQPKRTTRKSTAKKQTKRKRTALPAAQRKSTKAKTTKKVGRRKPAEVATTPPPEVQPTPPPPPPSGPYIDRGGDLPSDFGEDRIHALVRDPEWIYVYWELHGDRSNDLVRAHGGGKDFTDQPWHLRAYTPDGALQQEIPVFVGASNWYLRMGNDRKVVVEIGFYAPDGRFLVAASTGMISTPRGKPSTDRTETWMRRVPGQELRPGLQGYVLVPGEAPIGGAVDFPDFPGGLSSAERGGSGAGAWYSRRLVRHPEDRG